MCDKKANIKENSSKGDDNMDTVIERPCTPLKSIEKSVKEATLFLNGDKQLKTLEKSMELWEQWVNEEDE
jgi:hypothetical protein